MAHHLLLFSYVGQSGWHIFLLWYCYQKAIISIVWISSTFIHFPSSRHPINILRPFYTTATNNIGQKYNSPAYRYHWYWSGLVYHLILTMGRYLGVHNWCYGAVSNGLIQVHVSKWSNMKIFIIIITHHSLSAAGLHSNLHFIHVIKNTDRITIIHNRSVLWLILHPFCIFVTLVCWGNTHTRCSQSPQLSYQFLLNPKHLQSAAGLKY